MTRTDHHDFLKRLSRSCLLDVEQFQRACVIAQRESDAEQGALKLVAEDYLTRWQASQLLTTKSQSFFIGRYKLLKELGRGAMGTVYRAEDPALSRTVALKVMAPGYLKDQRAIARFQREIRTAAALDHSHIVRAFDAGYERNSYYLVMEHVEGLRHWIRAAGPLPISWCCECVRQAASGLQYAFEHAVTHRDLKPSNLLVHCKTLEAEPLVKIVDFGLARVGEELGGDEKLTRVGRTVGTWEYMAPEQTQDSALADTRSDIFGLGCTFFQMVTGALPFQAKSELESLLMRLNSDAPRLSSLRADVEPWLDNIVAKMLARKPAKRFQTPGELADALAASPKVKASKLVAQVVQAPPKLEASDDGFPKLWGSTDPEFDQFLETTPDLSTRSRVVVKSSGSHNSKRFPWIEQRLLVSVLASLGLLMLIVWGLTR